jgi:hypothetical protein
MYHLVRRIADSSWLLEGVRATQRRRRTSIGPHLDYTNPRPVACIAILSYWLIYLYCVIVEALDRAVCLTSQQFCHVICRPSQIVVGVRLANFITTSSSSSSVLWICAIFLVFWIHLLAELCAIMMHSVMFLFSLCDIMYFRSERSTVSHALCLASCTALSETNYSCYARMLTNQYT